MTTLEAVDAEIRREGYDSERSLRVVTRLCINDPAFAAELGPFALAALVDARIRAIEPPKKPQQAVKRSRRRASR